MSLSRLGFLITGLTCAPFMWEGITPVLKDMLTMIVRTSVMSCSKQPCRYGIKITRFNLLHVDYWFGVQKAERHMAYRWHSMLTVKLNLNEILRLVVHNDGGGRGLINTAIGLCCDRPALQPLRAHRLFNTQRGITEASAVAYNPIPVKFLIRSRSVLLYVIMLWRIPLTCPVVVVTPEQLCRNTGSHRCSHCISTHYIKVTKILRCCWRVC